MGSRKRRQATAARLPGDELSHVSSAAASRKDAVGLGRVAHLKPELVRTKERAQRRRLARPPNASYVSSKRQWSRSDWGLRDSCRRLSVLACTFSAQLLQEGGAATGAHSEQVEGARSKAQRAS